MQIKKQKRIILVSAIILALLLIASLVVYFTGAWFVLSRKAEGSLEFADGINIEFSNLYKDESTPTTSKLKLAYISENINGNELKPLELTNVKSNYVYSLANPTLSAKEGSEPYFLRVRFNVKYYFRNSTGDETLITDETREDFLATTSHYLKNGNPFVVANEKDLFKSLPMVDTNNFVEYNGWFYLGSASGAVESLSDITLTKNEFNEENNKLVSLFKVDSNEKILVEMDDSIDTGENLPFTKVEFSLDIQAVEENAIASAWNS